MDQVGAYKHTVASTYSFYKRSASRTNHLRQLTAALSDEAMTSVKQPCAVHWLALHKVVESMKNNWPALVMEIQEEAVGGSPSPRYHDSHLAIPTGNECYVEANLITYIRKYMVY